MKAMEICNYCSAQLPTGLQCNVCGSFLDTGKENIFDVEREVHPDHRTVGRCVISSKPVCSDCAVKSNGKILCPDPEHGIVLQEWRFMHTYAGFGV
jgi:hypothetical protein